MNTEKAFILSILASFDILKLPLLTSRSIFFDQEDFSDI